MSFSSMNAVNASKGMQGTSRQNEATFTGLGGALQGPSQGMGPAQPPAPAAPQGSSYSRGNGMTMANANPYRVAMADQPDDNGVIAGRPMGHNLGAVPRGLTQEQMQDPENAALAGFQFSQSQDQAVPQQRQVQVPQGSPIAPLGAVPAAGAAAYGPGPQGPQVGTMAGRGALQQAPLQAPKPPQYGRVM